MKFVERLKILVCEVVAPFTGAWVEIGRPEGHFLPSHVAPFTGAWVEIAGQPT